MLNTFIILYLYLKLLNIKQYRKDMTDVMYSSSELADANILPYFLQTSVFP